MRKLLLFLAIVTFTFAGDWLYEQLEFSGGETQDFDTIETFYTKTYEVGNGKKLPATLTITHFVTPDTSTESDDSVDCVINLQLSNTGESDEWYNYGAIDTIDLDSATVSLCGTTIGTKYIYPILDYRYFRLSVTSNTVDTFDIKLQKSVEFD